MLFSRRAFSDILEGPKSNSFLESSLQTPIFNTITMSDYVGTYSVIRNHPLYPIQLSYGQPCDSRFISTIGYVTMESPLTLKEISIQLHPCIHNISNMMRSCNLVSRQKLTYQPFVLLLWLHRAVISADQLSIYAPLSTLLQRPQGNQQELGTGD